MKTKPTKEKQMDPILITGEGTGPGQYAVIGPLSGPTCSFWIVKIHTEGDPFVFQLNEGEVQQAFLFAMGGPAPE